VRSEVGVLLEEAGAGDDALATLPCAASLPGRVVSRYGGRVDRSLLWYAMLQGLCAGTGDPYTAYMVPREFSYVQGALDRGRMIGVGAGFDIDPQTHELTVEDRIEGSPAAQSGLLAGDQVLSVNDVRVKGLSMERVYALMKVHNGATIYMRTQRPGESRVRVVSVMITPFEMPSVTSERLDRIGYVRVHAFGRGVGDQVAGAIDGLRRQGIDGLVLDLRNNGGGYVGAALELCSLFVPSHEVVMQVVDRSGRREELRAPRGTACGLPTVLLVNGYSASASEITAGCLKDHHCATLLGTTTYGKGCSQRVLPLGDGAAVKVTWAYFESPRGHRIHKVGVEPDVVVEMERRWVGQGRRDVQLQKALELLRARHP
jgi:carboxyl-terminal processing protease